LPLDYIIGKFEKNSYLKKSALFIVLINALILGGFLLFFLSSDHSSVDKTIKNELDDQQNILPIDPKLSKFIKRYEKQLERKFKHSNLPGAAVSIVIDGNVVFTKTLGFKSVNSLDKIDKRTAFRIASVSKGFASILMGIIKEKQQLKWEDPIIKHLPNFHTIPSPLAETITIKHILSHSSGYPYQAYSNLIEDGLARDVMLKELQNVKLSRKPGEIHSYQNVAYSLIEPILEDIMTCDYTMLIQEMIFDPLKMNQASISYSDMMYCDNKANPHLRSGKKFRSIPLSDSYYNVAAAGGINASISDMSQWMIALTGHRANIISKQVLDSVFAPVIPTRVRNSAFSSFDKPRKGYYGMGWRIVEYPNDTLVYHGGYANGFKSELALDRNKDIAICILTNGSGNFSSDMASLFFKSYKVYLESINKKGKKSKSIAPN
jgi:beta-lactamase class C